MLLKEECTKADKFSGDTSARRVFLLCVRLRSYETEDIGPTHKKQLPSALTPT